MIQIFGTAKDKVTRAAQRFFTDRGIKFQFVELKQKAMSKGELASVAKAVGGMQVLYDAKGQHAKDRGLQYSAPTVERLAEILEADPMLLVLPIVRDGAKAAVGDAPAVWKTFADAAKKI